MADKITTEIQYINPDPWVDEETMSEVCCEAVTPPPCQVNVEPWAGYTTAEISEILDINVDDKGLDNNGIPIQFLLVSPSSGICGEKETTYELKQESCCGEVSDILWDDAISAEVIAPSSIGIVSVSGGRQFKTWKVLGIGITFEHGLRELYTSDQNVILLTDENFCGSATVTVTDGCSEAVGYIRSTDGKWVLVSTVPCYHSGCGDFIINQTVTCISGNSKVTQRMAISYGHELTSCTGSALEVAVNFYCNNVDEIQQACFGIPNGWTKCINSYVYWSCASNYISVATIAQYKAYEWRC